MNSIVSNGLPGVHGQVVLQLVEKAAKRGIENAKTWNLMKSITTQLVENQVKLP